MKGLVDWIKQTLLNEYKTISPEDLDLIHTVDTPKEVTDILDAFYKQYQLSPNFLIIINSRKSIKLYYKVLLIVSFLSGYFVAYSQHYNEVDAVLNTETQTIEIQQKLKFQNHFDTPLTEIYFTDWVSSYSSPTTPLVEKFLNEFNTNLYIAKSKKEDSQQ